MAIVAVCGYPVRTALTVAFELTDRGVTFILAQVARDSRLLPDEGMNVLVASAMISITINPLLFRSIDSIKRPGREGSVAPSAAGRPARAARRRARRRRHRQGCL